VASLPLAQARQIEVVCNRFEAAWQTGDPPRIDDFLEGWTGAERYALQRELIALDSEYRGRNGLCGEATAARPHRVGEANDFPSQPGVAWEATIDAPPLFVLAPGSRLAGYEVIEEVGHGGRGIVYRVSDPEMNRPLAVKVLRPELRCEPGAVRRFLEEAQVTGQLQHPGIVPVHAIGRLPDGSPYLVMKLIQGRTLAKLLAERPTPAHVSRWFPPFGPTLPLPKDAIGIPPQLPLKGEGQGWVSSTTPEGDSRGNHPMFDCNPFSKRTFLCHIVAVACQSWQNPLQDHRRTNHSCIYTIRVIALATSIYQPRRRQWQRRTTRLPSNPRHRPRP
jgi:hypothetical protein